MNSVWQNDGPSAQLNVDISVAVATDNGLITPIVQNTPQLAVDEISATVRVRFLKTSNKFDKEIVVLCTKITHYYQVIEALQPCDDLFKLQKKIS